MVRHRHGPAWALAVVERIRSWARVLQAVSYLCYSRFTVGRIFWSVVFGRASSIAEACWGSYCRLLSPRSLLSMILQGSRDVLVVYRDH